MENHLEEKENNSEEEKIKAETGSNVSPDEETAKQMAELEERWKRALADYQNLERRVAEERFSYINSANISLLRKILPLKDNLEKAYASSPSQGLGLILKQFETLLNNEGIEEIKPLGEDFNPEYHECIEVTVGEADGKIVEILCPGYIMKGKVLRPAKVKVGRKNPEEKNLSYGKNNRH